ncbi:MULTISPECIES: methylated-DNA--[protein]-cysteine S-methyltransferase [Peptoniphilus]|jgi:methylated-DNA--[protein]-cysteine S-methyltransferase|uniref:methylated-DNA--[protein]-cysteine S-methyltransferase n=1 Tax=Peptoniphilus TaxID=162289 RepID=UPI0028FFD620|nr:MULTISPECIES: methylated-DNA--[protein]-cysteine S-methyltransferase [Peptoniphilus]MDU1043596.1 methylated-DNA--[protein]-cysteine S-methyltransferase [Peptoniphilus rhinitidis]MDU1954575.1 methylated-DNA--[protein]-cysteine S-methyltransferase [Peptoniphilus lacydonensis]MDU2109111.1 methylated-DNA--[protein]-cysteine S-methyltransferase [Peptoniphilus lacydonensis]MDU2115383.1 methylated-DNA--[protein]-cysteine S-methyltransferase [Peptoniphilus lacydonensis]MDU3750316.1 methylated-DNA--
MIYLDNYKSPLGNILIASDKCGLTGLWFENQKYFKENLKEDVIFKENNFIKDTKDYLDIYFSGRNPSFTPKVHMMGTDFRRDVWKILLDIPYGKTTNYKSIAQKLVEEKDYKKMSSQAVGGAVSHNPISIIIPCHRVVGKDGNLTGYAGGIDRKIKLLKLEKIDIENFFLPK